MDRLAFAAVWIVVFTIPWANMLVFGSTVTVTRAVGVTAFGVSVLAVLATGKLRPLKGIHIAMIAFVWLAALSFYWSLSPDHTLVKCWTYVQLVGMVWVIWQFGSTPARTRGLLHAYILGGYVAIAGTFADFAMAHEASHTRFAASGFDVNEIGLILALGIPIAWYLSTISRGLLAWVSRFYIPLAMVAIPLTASRTAFAVAILALLIIPWSFGRLSQRAKIAVGLATLGLVIAMYVVVPSTSWERIATTRAEVQEGDFGKRMDIWQAGLGVLSDHAVVGVGTGSFREAVEPILGAGLVAHNAFLSVLVENGIIGFSLFCVIVLWLFYLVVRMPPPERKVWLMMLVVWAVGASFLSWEYRHPTWLLWGLVAANAYAVDDPVRHRASGHTLPTQEGCTGSEMGLESVQDGR